MMTSRLRYRCSGCGYTTLQRKRIGDHVDGHRRNVERQGEASSEDDVVDSSAADQVRILIQIEERKLKPASKSQQVKRKRRCWTDDLLAFSEDDPQKTTPRSLNNKLHSPPSEELSHKDTAPGGEKSLGKRQQQPLKVTAFKQLSAEVCADKGAVKNSPGGQSDGLRRHHTPDQQRGDQACSDTEERETPTQQTPPPLCSERRNTYPDAALSTAYQSMESDWGTPKVPTTVTLLPPLGGMVRAAPHNHGKHSVPPLDCQLCVEKGSTCLQESRTSSPHNRMGDTASTISSISSIPETTDNKDGKITKDRHTEEQRDGTPVIMDVFSLTDYTGENLQQDTSLGNSVPSARRASLHALSMSCLDLTKSEPREATPSPREIRSAPPAFQTHRPSVDSPTLNLSPIGNWQVSTANNSTSVKNQLDLSPQASKTPSNGLYEEQICKDTKSDSQNASNSPYQSGDLPAKDQGSLQSVDRIVYNTRSSTKSKTPVSQEVAIDRSLTASNTLPLTTCAQVTSSDTRTSNSSAPDIKRLRTIAPRPNSVDRLRSYFAGESRIFRCFQCPFMCLEKKLLLIHMREEQCYTGTESAIQTLRRLKEGHTARDTLQLQASNETCHAATKRFLAEKSVREPPASTETASVNNNTKDINIPTVVPAKVNANNVKMCDSVNNNTEGTNIPTVVPVQAAANNVKTFGSADLQALVALQNAHRQAQELSPKPTVPALQNAHRQAQQLCPKPTVPAQKGIIPKGKIFPPEVNFAAFKQPVTIRNQHPNKPTDPVKEDIIVKGTAFPTEVKFAAFKQPVTIRNQHPNKPTDPVEKDVTLKGTAFPREVKFAAFKRPITTRNQLPGKPTDFVKEDIIPKGTTFPTEVKFAAFEPPITIRNQHQANKLREILQHEHLKARFMHMLQVRFKRALTGENDKSPGLPAESSSEQHLQAASANVQGPNVETGSPCNTHTEVSSSSPALSPPSKMNVRNGPTSTFGRGCSEENFIDLTRAEDMQVPATPGTSIQGERISCKQTKTPVPKSTSRRQRRKSPSDRTQTTMKDDPSNGTFISCNQEKKSTTEEGQAVYNSHKAGQIGASVAMNSYSAPLSPPPLLKLTKLTMGHDSYHQDNVKPTTEACVSQQQPSAMPCTTTDAETTQQSPNVGPSGKRRVDKDEDVSECSPAKRPALQAQNISLQDFQHLMCRRGQGGSDTTNLIYGPQPQGPDPVRPLRPLVDPVGNSETFSADPAIAVRPVVFAPVNGLVKAHNHTLETRLSAHTTHHARNLITENQKADQSMPPKCYNGAIYKNVPRQTLAWPPNRSPVNVTSPLDMRAGPNEHAAYRLDTPPLYKGKAGYIPVTVTSNEHCSRDRHMQINAQETGGQNGDVSSEPIDLRVRKRRPSPPPLIHIEPLYYPRTAATPPAGIPIQYGGTGKDGRFTFNGEANSHMSSSREKLAVILNEIEASVCTDYAASRVP